MKYQQKPTPPEQVDAWQYQPDQPIPVWVARKCHRLDDGDTLTVNSVLGVMKAKPGTWIVNAPEIGIVALSAEDFAAQFEPAGVAAGAQLIADERWRQVEKEGWTPDHDDTHLDHELARAAVCYVLASRVAFVLEPGEEAPSGPPKEWPWDSEHWRPSLTDPVRNLAKAGALIAAEIDRLQRIKVLGRVEQVS